MTTPLPFAPDDFDAVLFDMDGTLLNTDDVDVSRWTRRIARIYGPGERAETLARRLVMALETPANTLFTFLDWFGLDAFFIRLAVAAKGYGDAEAQIPPIARVDEMVRQLQGRYRLGIVSTRTVAESERLLAEMGIREHFEAIAGRDTTWRIKPHPQPVMYAARRLRVDPRRCLMVGDTTVDVRAGRRAGARTCAVLCGYGERPELERAGADLILEETALLGDLLDGLPDERAQQPVRRSHA